AGVVAVPARTAPIDEPRGVAELTSVDVGDTRLSVMVRGRDVNQPVLLFLAGGPGGSELGAMRRHLSALESHFVVVTLDPTSAVTVDRMVSDVRRVTAWLRARFGGDRIVLVGQSWGSLLGSLVVAADPEPYSALVGVGQMVSPQETDRAFWADTLAWARRTGRSDLVAELTELGPPPYADVLDYEPVLSYEHDVYPYDHSRNEEGAGGFSENLFVEEYSLLDKLHAFGAFLDTFAVLYPDVTDIDLRRDAPRLEVPVFFVQGAHEARGRAEPFTAWFASLQAPSKQTVVFATSGHRPMFEQPDEFVTHLRDVVLPVARGAAASSDPTTTTR
ncbi:MAG: alpha/beta fold hydrolase, partial [Dermatophilaceae bacterium]